MRYLSSSLFPSFSRDHPLPVSFPKTPPFLSTTLRRIAGHSIYISVLSSVSSLTREFPWLRYPPGGEPIRFPSSLHLPISPSGLSPFRCFPSVLFRHLFLFLFAATSSSIGSPVRCNYDVTRRRVRAARQDRLHPTGCVYVALIERFS